MIIPEDEPERVEATQDADQTNILDHTTGALVEVIGRSHYSTSEKVSPSVSKVNMVIHMSELTMR